MDRNSYILTDIVDNQYDFLLISTDMSRLEDYLIDVENDLKLSNRKCYILFDLLLNNSISDRFYKCFFDGNKFNLKTLSRVSDKELNNELLKLSTSYYYNNIDLFEDIFFSEEYKRQIKNQLQEIIY
ncbi:MAG: type II toxin-antitoxin system RnlB family antitoxin [Flavobacterium sp.]